MSQPDGSEAGGPSDAGDDRDRAAGERDVAGGRRDVAGNDRDAHGIERDEAGDVRDEAGSQRDRAATHRDESARLAETSADPPFADALRARWDHAREEAAADRLEASRDRVAGASDRSHSGRDRAASRADRSASETERSTSGHDRTDASAERSAAAEHRASTAIDELTSAYVRSAGLGELAREMARVTRTGEPLSLAFVDVDHLKAINDELGHAAGDQVLTAVVHAIRDLVRPYDLVIRHGGDEFLCALAGLNLGDAVARLSRVNAALSRGEPPTSVTIGVAAMTPADTPAELIARADADLYRQRTPSTRHRVR